MDCIFVYESRTHFYVVGEIPSKRNFFRVLKIDRRQCTESIELVDDHAEYSEEQLNRLIDMIDEGNKSIGGLKLIDKYFGILGFVKFLQGYYMLLIKKKSIVAKLGAHTIFEINDTSLINLLHSSTKIERHADEAKYIEIFSQVDLNRDFYFSYSYDLTKSLQDNQLLEFSPEQAQPLNDMFIWNFSLLAPFVSDWQSSPWFIRIIHGYVKQTRLSFIPCRSLYFTLLARRSRIFAGARFYKRGVNDLGYVANDVETEQILQDFRSISHSEYSAFVQHRGSIPLFWSQETSVNLGMKPPIQMILRDPFFAATLYHFENLMQRFGLPIIALDLVKQHEAVPRESLLLEEFDNAISYVNQFLSSENGIEHIQFDLKKAAKIDPKDMILFMEKLSASVIERIGIFHSKVDDSRKYRKLSLQHGVLRSNCIDCLDRTNAAQFLVAKRILAHQLHVMGALETPLLDTRSPVAEQLGILFHEHGNTIALQYGGSHLVKTIESYQKKPSWAVQSKDLFNIVQRYYSNSFTDADKQDAMNLFLGNFTPSVHQPALWELTSDYYLHNEDPRCTVTPKKFKLSVPNRAMSQPTLVYFPLVSSAQESDRLWSSYYNANALTSIKDETVMPTLEDGISSTDDEKSREISFLEVSKADHASTFDEQSALQNASPFASNIGMENAFLKNLPSFLASFPTMQPFQDVDVIEYERYLYYYQQYWSVLTDHEQYIFLQEYPQNQVDIGEPSTVDHEIYVNYITPSLI